MKVQVKEPTPVFRKDYRQPDYWIDEVHLSFDLGAETTRVKARLEVRRNQSVNDGHAALVLVGEDLTTLRVALDGRVLATDEYTVSEGSLTIPGVPDHFELETEVDIHPAANKALSGLYVSDDTFCTQCEAEGFRRITWFLDRPDVMARYTVEITGDAKACPVMLSNGNRTSEEVPEGGRHRVVWKDPFPKPCYLFALVAGDLACHSGTFTTKSERDVRLEIWVEHRDADKCEHALRSLQRAMKWDEQRFGLEYDLDIYMIVAVSAFNMGAMENKGLNIFNSAYVLARQDTATDADYQNIEAVIAHEYFHNWTGNRVTCRDWFQLTLKEGLTVFRDQEFTADMTSRAVKRIGDVRSLRTVQFAEDAGPTAHPVRPDSYVKMDNFYTSTVYEKGATVVRMYQTLLGRDGFRKGMDLYFERHDGDAVTCDDFLAAMADANGVDLAGLGRWYSQAGTPTVHATGVHDAAAKTFALTLTQSLPSTHSGPEAVPLHIPVATGLLGASGADMQLELDGVAADGTTVNLELVDWETTFTFTGVSERPVPSLLRDFSAPVKLEMDRERTELAFLAANDSDAFNRWEALQTLGRDVLLELAAKSAAGGDLAMDSSLTQAVGKVLADTELDGALKALALVLPSERELAQSMDVIDPDALFAARRFARRSLAEAHADALRETYDANVDATYSNDQAAIARRSLKNAALGYLAALETEESIALVGRQFDGADNMTDSFAALAILSGSEHAERERCLKAFYERWKDEALVVDKWFAVQAGAESPATFDRVLALARHPDFTLENPNRARSLLRTFAANQVHFHRIDGAAYRFHADRVIELDGSNPQLASRLVSAFNPWKRFDAARQALMRTELERILDHDRLSKDVFEIASKALGG